jgi:hypothetical protein
MLSEIMFWEKSTDSTKNSVAWVRERTIQLALKSSKMKRGQLELSQEARLEMLAEIYLKM